MKECVLEPGDIEYPLTCIKCIQKVAQDVTAINRTYEWALQGVEMIYSQLSMWI